MLRFPVRKTIEPNSTPKERSSSSHLQIWYPGMKHRVYVIECLIFFYGLSTTTNQTMVIDAPDQSPRQKHYFVFATVYPTDIETMLIRAGFFLGSSSYWSLRPPLLGLYICIIRKCQARYPPLYVSLRCAYSVDCCCRLRRSMGVVKTPLVLRRNSRMCISFGSIIVALERVRAPWLCSIATTWLCSGAAMHECA